MRVNRYWPIVLLGCTACSDAADRAAQERQQQSLRTVRDGLNRVRGTPGGSIATFTQVRLVGTDIVCGRVDGQDGFGARRFTTDGKAVTVEEPREPARLATIERECSKAPSRRVINRNPDYSDITVEDSPS